MKAQLKANVTYYFNSLEEENYLSILDGVEELEDDDYYHLEEEGYSTQAKTKLHLNNGQIFDYIRDEEDLTYTGGIACVLKLNGLELKISKSLLTLF